MGRGRQIIAFQVLNIILVKLNRHFWKHKSIAPFSSVHNNGILTFQTSVMASLMWQSARQSSGRGVLIVREKQLSTVFQKNYKMNRKLWNYCEDLASFALFALIHDGHFPLLKSIGKMLIFHWISVLYGDVFWHVEKDMFLISFCWNFLVFLKNVFAKELLYF